VGTRVAKDSSSSNPHPAEGQNNNQTGLSRRSAALPRSADRLVASVGVPPSPRGYGGQAEAGVSCEAMGRQGRSMEGPGGNYSCAVITDCKCQITDYSAAPLPADISVHRRLSVFAEEPSYAGTSRLRPEPCPLGSGSRAVEIVHLSALIRASWKNSTTAGRVGGQTSSSSASPAAPATHPSSSVSICGQNTSSPSTVDSPPSTDLWALQGIMKLKVKRVRYKVAEFLNIRAFNFIHY